MEPDPEVAELRKLLTGVEWMDFHNGKVVVRGDVEFRARYGLYLNQLLVVVIANNKFIASVKMPLPPATDAWLNFIQKDAGYQLYPNIPSSGTKLEASPGKLRERGIVFVLPEENSNGQHA